MKRLIRTFNALLILTLMSVLITSIYQEFTLLGPPCVLCLLQRLGMIGVATALMMNLRFGIHLKYYAFAMLSSILGGAISVKQILLHICPEFSSFGTPIFGYSLYTWAFIVFVSSLVTLIVMMAFHRADQKQKMPLNWLERITFLVLILISVANLIITLHLCGFIFCSV